jgi:sorbitol-specific phosphotransferase system component IIBC
LMPEAVVDIIAYSLPLLTTGITAVLTMAGFYLNRKYQNSKLTQALFIVNQIVIDVVKELNQTVVDELKAARMDGKLTRDEADQIKHKAIEMTLQRLGMDLLKTIQSSMGPITDLLATKIEAAVFDHKRAIKLGNQKVKALTPAIKKQAR